MWYWILVSWGYAQPNSASMQRALAESQEKTVRYRSHLGEGEGYFDPASRWNVDEVNCMTWLQWVLARNYAPTPEDVPVYLDSLRYYGTEISFAHRKHYIDRWVNLEPEPLKPIENPLCQANSSKTVNLPLDSFLEHHKYMCSLYAEEQRQFTISYMSTSAMHSCIPALDDGYYVLFFVASDAYLARWSPYGEMGLVHSMILEIKDTQYSVHHASVDKKAVVTEDWFELSKRLDNVAIGYTIYDIAPTYTAKQMHSHGDASCAQR